jgi:hypothetical protein
LLEPELSPPLELELLPPEGLEEPIDTAAPPVPVSAPLCCAEASEAMARDNTMPMAWPERE